jgi:hypothetical protein
LTKIREAYKKVPFRSVFGLSKDGRPIYTPNYGDGKDYDDCDVDICNGIKINGHYSYVSTYFHPYVMGCFGPGDSPNLSQQCSAVPRACNVGKPETDNATLIKASVAAAGLLAVQTLF